MLFNPINIIISIILEHHRHSGKLILSSIFLLHLFM